MSTHQIFGVYLVFTNMFFHKFRISNVLCKKNGKAIFSIRNVFGNDA